MIANLVVIVFGGGSVLALLALAVTAAGIKVDRLVEHAKTVGLLREQDEQREEAE